jgi:hypothetical protein
MFDELNDLAITHGLVMTCYVDDITFSGDGATRSVLFEARKIIARYGLKSHKAKVFNAQTPKVVTGLCETQSGERVPNRLHLKISEGFVALRAAKTPAEQLRIAAPLLGRMHAAQQIDQRFGARAKTLRAKLKTSS